jgi:thiamine pyrophosphokinase
MVSTCIIVSGGDPPHLRVRDHLPRADLVIAADSGLDHADAMGLGVDLVLGDLDSVSKEALDRARRHGIPVEGHPAAKDETDLELALRAAVDRGATRVVVVGGSAGRVDHMLGGALALAAPSVAGMAVEAWLGAAWVRVLVGPARVDLEGRPGELVSLIPVGGPAHGVRTEDLVYPLCRETLDAGSCRGVSNELVHGIAAVEVEAGTLLVIRPEALEVDG